MDVLTKEECQAIIDSDHNWEEVDARRANGGKLRFKEASIDLWKKTYPYMLKEVMLKYEVGDLQSEHVDTAWRINPKYRVHAVWITPLNNDYEGGDLYVEGKLIEQVIGIPIKHLRTTPHEITEVTKGTRYSIVSWVFVRTCKKC